MTITGRVLTILLAAALFPWSGVSAQQLVLAGEDSPKIYIRMPESSDPADLEAAREYEYFVERLESLAYDYQKSFARFDDYYAIQYQALLQKLILKISQGKFCSDPERLRDEMEYLRKVIHDQQDELEEETDNLKLGRLSRKLESELQMLIDEFDEEIMLELAEDISRESVIEYLKQERHSSHETREIYTQTLIQHKELIKRIQEAFAAAAEVDKKLLTEEQLRALEEVAKLKDEIDDWSLAVEIPEIEVVPVPDVTPQIGLPPSPPSIIILTPKDRMTVDKAGKAVAYREYTDSIKVSSIHVPIFINSETGVLRVTGWDSNQVMVRFNVEIAAESEGDAQTFAGNIEVKLSGNEKGIYLKSVFPSLSDPKRRILLSNMDVRIPTGNSVICENSFGTVKLSNLTQGVKLNSSYCDVYLDNIRGEITAVSKMNPLSISNSSGTIRLRNSMGAILVDQCEGDIDIENSYSPVELTNSKGPVVVKNSGQITISDHAGQVTVENSNGPVDITDLNGNLIARNSYKPLTASDIRGSVELFNLSSAIDVGDVTGKVTASNKFGNITGRYLSGPIEINNEVGTTQLTIHEKLTGPSVITSVTGTVQLDMTNESNVLLTVRTDGGRIVGAGANAIRKDGQVSSTELKFGRADSPLNVKAANSTVVITVNDGI